MVSNYIDGKWQKPSASLSLFDVINPATEEVIAQTPLGGEEEINSVVKVAQKAFETWRTTPVVDRIQPLFKLKMLLEENLDDLAKVCTQENGKTFAESKAEFRRAIQMVETATSMPTLMQGKFTEDIAGGVDCVSIRQPLGVFAAITPFNFPSMISFWFWPFCVAAGNACVVKPSERVPLTQMKIFELVDQCGFPPGVINLVHGGKEAVNALCRHPDIQGVSFVGSTPVARHVYVESTKTTKRVQALGGSKNFVAVTPDAVRDKTVRTALESAIGCAGERCLAASVMVGIGDETYQWLCDDLSKLATDVVVGDGLDPKTQMGPVISKESLDRISGLIERAEKAGAKILVDGRKAKLPSKGYFLAPTVIADVTEDMEIAKEEIFGPVVIVAKSNSLQDVIDWVNRSPYGNTASIFTSSGAAARQFSSEVHPGMIGVNIGVPAPMSFFSFGGTKDSFFGDVRAHGSTSVEFFTNTKVVTQRWIKESSIW